MRDDYSVCVLLITWHLFLLPSLTYLFYCDYWLLLLTIAIVIIHYYYCEVPSAIIVLFYCVDSWPDIGIVLTGSDWPRFYYSTVICNLPICLTLFPLTILLLFILLCWLLCLTIYWLLVIVEVTYPTLLLIQYLPDLVEVHFIDIETPNDRPMVLLW